MSQIKLQRKCPICLNTKANHISTQKFFLLESCKLPNQLKIVECSDCNFVFSDTSAKQADYDAHYHSSEKYALKQVFTEYEQRHANELADIVSKNFPTLAKILEIGSGNGCLMYKLSQAGYKKLFAVDPNYSEELMVTEFVTRRGNFGTIPYTGKETFDLVILCHVAEHVYDLQAMMRDIKALLSPGGHLLIEVPNGREYHRHLESPFQDFNIEHINHFTPHSLTNLLRTNGFEISNLTEGAILIGHKKTYPVIRTLSQYAGTKDHKAQSNTSDRESFELYVSKSLEYLQIIKTHLDRVLETHEKIILWGVGQLSYKLLEENIIPRDKIHALVDSSFSESKIDSLTQFMILNPAMITEVQYPILIGSTISKDSIMSSIHKLGLTNPLITLADYPSRS